MSATKVTYATKESGGSPKTIHIQQWWFEDANEVKSVTDNHADRINQFTFTPLLNGDIGLGIVPASRLHVKANAGQSSILKLETSSGFLTLQADENGNVWNQKFASSPSVTNFGRSNGASITTALAISLFGSNNGNSLNSNGNTIIGNSNGNGIVNGVDNTLAGQEAGTLFEGSRNTMSGVRGFRSANILENSCGYGADAGRFFGKTPSASDIVTEVRDGVFLGTNTRSLNATSLNEIAVGFDAVGGGDNTATFGNDNIRDTFLKGTVHMKGTVPGLDLLEVESTFGTNVFSILDNERVKVSSNNKIPFVVEQKVPYSSPFDQQIQAWVVNGVVVATMRASGSLSIVNGFKTIEAGVLNFNNDIGSPSFPNIKADGSVGATGISFTSNKDIVFSKLGIAISTINQFGLGLGRNQIGTDPSGDPIFENAVADATSAFVVGSDNQGSIPFPKLTQVQRTSISSPSTGLHVYQTDGTEGVYVHKSTGWVLAY